MIDRWRWYTSPLAWSLGVSALILLAVLVPSTPRLLAVIPLATTLYALWVFCSDEEEAS